jgi:D-serine deaminase-like pyridoxal phosphate-dependent protein
MYRGITEIRPGTYVFNDRTQVAHGAAKPGGVATSVLTTVVSRPAADVAVIDAGTKALTSDRMNVPGAATDFGAAAGSGWPVIRASEEHGIVAVPAGESPRVGDRMSIVPNHICPVVNLFDEAVVVEDGRVAARWSVAARGRTT